MASTPDSPIHAGLLRCVKSAKFVAAAGMAINDLCIVLVMWPGSTRIERLDLLKTLAHDLAKLVGLVILLWGVEDAVAKFAAKPSAPAAPDVVVTAVGQQTPPAADPAPKLPAPHPTAPRVGAPGAAPMKLPPVLLALVLLVGVGGCQAGTADYVLYRDRLHAADEPIYVAAEHVADDAVKAGIRPPSFAASVHYATGKARHLYERSVANAPTTQP